MVMPSVVISQNRVTSQESNLRGVPFAPRLVVVASLGVAVHRKAGGGIPLSPNGMGGWVGKKMGYGTNR
jgi:hypothetical protein